jgi:general stress protein YciG
MAEETRDYTEDRISEQGSIHAAEERGSMTVVEAGKRGGEKTARTHDHEFYREIGHKGGKKGGKVVRELTEEGQRALATRAEARSHAKGHSIPRRES